MTMCGRSCWRRKRSRSTTASAGSSRRSSARPANFPPRCAWPFPGAERPAREGDISQADALAILEKSEEVGLVHTVSNVMQGVGYVCNCCGCCCGILRGITEWGIERSVAYANYYAVIDPAFCAELRELHRALPGGRHLGRRGLLGGRPGTLHRLRPVRDRLPE